MSSGIIENAEDLKALYLQTDITNVAAIQTTIQENQSLWRIVK